MKGDHRGVDFIYGDCSIPAKALYIENIYSWIFFLNINTPCGASYYPLNEDSTHSYGGVSEHSYDFSCEFVYGKFLKTNISDLVLYKFVD